MSEAPERVWLRRDGFGWKLSSSVLKYARPINVEYVLASVLAETVEALRELMDDFRGQTTRYSQSYDKGDGWRLADAVLAKYDAARATTPADEVSHDG